MRKGRVHDGGEALPLVLRCHTQTHTLPALPLCDTKRACVHPPATLHNPAIRSSNGTKASSSHPFPSLPIIAQSLLHHSSFARTTATYPPSGVASKCSTSPSATYRGRGTFLRSAVKFRWKQSMSSAP